ncbi:MAG: aryl-sulfate sulfotransferase [Deltaproteobacteria bacterium]|nr:aryl-sulfate sulfotransferase [Deltaproteobacteria bacterium]
MKKIFAGLIFILLMAFAASALAWPSIYPTGTTIYNPDKVFNGYTLFTSGHVRPAAEPFDSPATMYLINMNGEVVHTWKLPFETHHGVLKPNGNLVIICADNKAVPGRPGVAPFNIGGHMGWLYELDWDGNIVFQHFDPEMHHDFSQMKSGNFLYLGWEQVPKALQKKIRGGVKGSEHIGGVMWGTTIKEVNRKGEIVWTWSAVKNWDPALDVMGNLHSRNEWGHANAVAEMDSGDIVFSAKHTDTVYIVDKKSGKVKWRWGSMTYIDKETGRLEFKRSRAPDTLGGQHAAYEIPPGLPGAGNILIYDNGMYVGHSRAVEVDWKTNKVVWETPGSTNRSHFSGYISAAKRLPNGNTLITSGAQGRLFEVTRDKEIVWEYIHKEPHIFRSHRYAPDFCPQFKDLPSAKGPGVAVVDVLKLQMPTVGKPMVMKGKGKKGKKGGPPGGKTGSPPGGKKGGFPGGKKGPPPGGKK